MGLVANLPVVGSGGGIRIGLAEAMSLPVVGSGGGIRIGLAANLPVVGKGGGIRIGLAEAMSLPVVGSGGGIRIGLKANVFGQSEAPGQVGIGGGGRTGLAEAAPTAVTRTEVKTARRTCSELKTIMGLLLWEKLCKEIVPHKLYIFYNKSNILMVIAILFTAWSGFPQGIYGSQSPSVRPGTPLPGKNPARKQYRWGKSSISYARKSR
jgi:hypothetical protein